jgi:RNA-binding protein
VQVGKDGISEGLVGALDAALEQHELIKVRLGESVTTDRHEMGAALAEAASAELVQVLGRTLLLYRRRVEEPTIELPQ